LVADTILDWVKWNEFRVGYDLISIKYSRILPVSAGLSMCDQGNEQKEGDHP
jgi:hypothetical protein